MIDVLEQLRMMSYRIRINLLGALPELVPPVAVQETPSDSVLQTYRHVVFGNEAESILLDRTFNPQEMEEARALLVASHRSFQDSESVKVVSS